MSSLQEKADAVQPNAAVEIVTPTGPSSVHDSSEPLVGLQKGKAKTFGKPDGENEKIPEVPALAKFYEFYDSKDENEKNGIDLVVVFMCNQKGTNGGILEYSESDQKSPQPTRSPTVEDKEPIGVSSGTSFQGAAKDPTSTKHDSPIQSQKKSAQTDQQKQTSSTPAPKSSWLKNKDLLQLFPATRALGFGLVVTPPGNINFKAAAKHLQDWLVGKRRNCVSRPIAFVGHGFGNVVIQTLCSENHPESTEKDAKANVDSRNAKEILDATIAVALFAPPFDETQDLIQWTTQSLFDQAATSSLRIPPLVGLAPPSKALQQIWEKFSSWAKHNSKFLTVVALLEKSSSIGKKVTLAKSSPDGVDEVLWTSHLIGTICQISKADDPRLQFLCESFTKFIWYAQFLAAIKDDEPDFVRVALSDKINANLAGRDGKAPLHLAVQKSSDEIVSLLLESPGLDVDIKDGEGKTALYYAVDQNDYDMVERLLTAGANADVRNSAGASPRRLAQSKMTKIQTLLQSPPLIEGPSLGRQIMTKGKPPGRFGDMACSGAEVTSTKVFVAKNRSFDTFRQEVVKSVGKFIYSETDIDAIFDRVTPNQELANGDKKPSSDDSSRKVMCRWHHLPMNNMAWVQDLFLKLKFKENPWPSLYRDVGHPQSRCMHPQAVNKTTDDGYEICTLMMPYISYQNAYGQQKINRLLRKLYAPRPKWTDIVLRRRQALRHPQQQHEEDDSCREDSGSSDVDSDDDDEDEEDEDLGESPKTESQIFERHMKRVIRAYVDYTHQGVKLPLHPRRTLDQSYYYMLKNTSYRDRSQVVSLWQKPTRDSNHNILMVDQLWLWRIRKDGEQDIVITSFPSRDGALHESKDGEFEDGNVRDDLQGAVLKETDRARIDKTDELVARIVEKCCRTLTRRQDYESLRFLELFEMAVGKAEESLTKLFQDFRSVTKQLHDLHEKHPDYQKKKGKILKKLADIRKESKLLKEIKDIRDEIKMVLAVFDDQSVSLAATKKYFGLSLTNAESLLETSAKDFTAMESHAKTVEDGLQKLLELEQLQANLWEARSSRENASETARQGKALTVFTVVTIIFLPLSFMASFFALAIAQFPKDKQGNTSWPLHSVSTLLFGISFGVSIPFIFFAFNFNWIAAPFHVVRHIWLKKLLVWLLTPLRLTDRTLLLSFGFRQNLQLTRSIIEYEDPRGASDAKMATERVIDLAKKWRLNSWNTRTGVYYVLDDVANSTTDEWAAACRTLLDEGWLQDRPGHKFVLQRARSGWGGIFLRQMADRRTAYF